MKSVDEKLLRAQSRHSLFDSKPTPSLISPKKVPSFARQGDASIKKNNYVDNLVTSRYNNSKDEPLTTYDGHEVSARDLE